MCECVEDVRPKDREQKLIIFTQGNGKCTVFFKVYTSAAYILKRRTADDGLVLRDQQGYRLCDVTDPSGGFVTSGARHSANNSST
jgi:hypothetical protein